MRTTGQLAAPRQGQKRSQIRACDPESAKNISVFSPIASVLKVVLIKAHVIVVAPASASASVWARHKHNPKPDPWRASLSQKGYKMLTVFENVRLRALFLWEEDPCSMLTIDSTLDRLHGYRMRKIMFTMKPLLFNSASVFR